MLITLTFYQHFTKYRRQKNEDFDDLSQLRTTTKRTEEEKIIFKTNVLVPREEGATVAATPILLCKNSAGSLVRAGRAAFSIEDSKSVGNSH